MEGAAAPLSIGVANARSHSEGQEADAPVREGGYSAGGVYRGTEDGGRLTVLDELKRPLDHRSAALESTNVAL